MDVKKVGKILPQGLSVEEQRVLAKRSVGACLEHDKKERLFDPLNSNVNKSRKRAKTATGSLLLPVYVSDEHNGALTNIHCAIRMQELPFENIGILHVDSHPDLSIPLQMSADLVFQPRELQYHLDNSVTGIAEFILPLVYAGHVSSVYWVRAPWSDQLTDGTESFSVGNLKSINQKRGPLRVTSLAPYFADEGMTAPHDQLENVKTVLLGVGKIDSATQGACALLGIGDRGSSAWVLDICLDYFSVQNPFFLDIEQAVGQQGALSVRQAFFDQGLVWKSLERQRENDPKNRMLAAAQKQAKRQFDDAMAYMFFVVAADESSQQQLTAVNNFARCFLKYVPGLEIAQRFLALLKSATPQVRSILQESGPNLDLPHMKNDNHTILRMLGQLEVALANVNARPNIVTIAKSSSDDFTPQDQLDFILENVLAMLARLWGKINVEFDQYEYE